MGGGVDDHDANDDGFDHEHDDDHVHVGIKYEHQCSDTASVSSQTSKGLSDLLLMFAKNLETDIGPPNVCF